MSPAVKRTRQALTNANKEIVELKAEVEELKAKLREAMMLTDACWTFADNGVDTGADADNFRGRRKGDRRQSSTPQRD